MYTLLFIFYSSDLMSFTRTELEPQFQALLERTLLSYDDLVVWIKDCDSLDASLSVDFVWRYIHQSTNTADAQAESDYNDFLQTIYPHWITYGDKLGRKLIANEFVDQLPAEYHNYVRGVKHGVEMFREENVALSTQEEEIKSQFAKIAGAQTIVYQNQELTIQQANDYLKNSDRAVRKEVFELIEARKKQDAEKLDEIMSQLIQIRTQIARNCGFESYTDYKYSYRYDYTKDQINEFHESIRQVITPLGKKFFDNRKKLL